MFCCDVCWLYSISIYIYIYIFLMLAPQTPTDWSKKKREPLGKLSSLFKLLVMLLDSFHALSSEDTCPEPLASVGHSLIAVLHNIISHVSLPSMIGTMFAVFSKPLAVFYEKTK